LSFKRLSFRGFCCITVLMTMSLPPCRNGMAGQLSSVSGQLHPGPNIALGPLLLLVAPYG
jgi:hypothetical protein